MNITTLEKTVNKRADSLHAEVLDRVLWTIQANGTSQCRKEDRESALLEEAKCRYVAAKLKLHHLKKQARWSSSDLLNSELNALSPQVQIFRAEYYRLRDNNKEKK